MNPELPPDEPSELDPHPEPDDSNLDYEDIPCTDGTDDEDSRWDAFIPDDDELEPEPGQGDFWIENRRVESPLLAATAHGRPF